MFNKFERMIAFRYLRSRKEEGFVSIIAGFSFLGIMLGVATLIVVMSVMNGFHEELLKRILGINSHISIMHSQGQITDYQRLTDNLKSLPGIHNASPMVQGQVLATANDKHTGAMVRGMELNDLKNKELVADNILYGDFWQDNHSVLIGARMARNMHLVPGDQIRLISPKSSTTFFGDIPRVKDYTIAGIFEVGMFEYDSSTIFMPIESAQIYFRSKEAATSIEVDLRTPKDIETVKDEIKARLSSDYYMVDWKAANSSFFSSLKVERNVMFLILTLIIVIAAFNIISGMVMLVTGKNKEIAILRTIGATRGSIMRIFILCGASIGFLGTFLGYLLGLGFALNIESIREVLQELSHSEFFPAEVYFLSQLPANVENSDVYGVVILSLSLSLLATLYPSWRASRISPVEGLHNE